LLQAGSITPIWNAGGLTVSAYIFIDATGAEYRLDQNSGNVWTSKESVYVWFDANATVLYFRDGGSWYFGCTSNSAADAGVLYPTLLTDMSGNQIVVTYIQGGGASWLNSSAKIDKVIDVRAQSGSHTYSFSYSSGFSISNTINSGEHYSFGFSTVALTSPFDSQSFGSPNILTSAALIPGTFSFQYNNSGEMTRITLPTGGYLRYDYGTMLYSSGRSYREVTTRYLSKNGSTETAYPFAHEPSPGPDVHQYTSLNDPGGIGQKYWAFSTSGVNMGLVTQYQGRQLPGPLTLVQHDFTWAQNATLNSYVASTLSTADPGQAYQAQKKVNQTVDQYGNVTQVQNFNYGNLTTPARTNDYYYVASGSFTSRYIFNRLNNANVTEGGVTKTLITNTYGTTVGYGSFARPTSVQTLQGTRTFTYDVYGNVTGTTLNNGMTTFISMDTVTTSVPAQLTVGSLTEAMTYNSFLGLSNETGPNGMSSSIAYQNIARPSSTTSATGAVTNFTYTTNTTTATINNRWTRSTTDGLGRTIKTEAGTGSPTSNPVSVVETEYDSCGCSPTGKMKRTSLPHAFGAAAIWTTYTYDGIGRTVSVLSPDGASSTTYLYQGNTVTVTDPAMKWKKYTSDAFGRLTQVNEPNPAGGADYITNYTYDLLDHLTGVSMPRPSGTQTRTFNYGTPPGAFLMSATNPENGTVTYTYDSKNRLETKIDAKGQKMVYGYDTYNRLKQVSRYYNGTNIDSQQGTQYFYDSNTSTYDSSYSTNVLGRLAWVQYYGGNCTSLGPPRTGCDLIQESYKYDSAGLMLGKRVRIIRGAAHGERTASWTYDNEGRVLRATYPSSSAYDHTYNTMGRLNTMTRVSGSNIVTGVTYGTAGEMLSMTGMLNETRTYNSMFQLTRITVPSVLDIQYAYSSANNNGKLTSQTDVLSGEQITYTYDALNRLASAVTSDNPSVTQWGYSYNYDGFGNLTDQNQIKGSVAQYHVAYNVSTNRQTGDTADANGNIGLNHVYDIENRLLRAGTAGSGLPQYGYDLGNKRIARDAEFTFWARNEKWETYTTGVSGSSVTFTLTGVNVYFGGRLLAKGASHSTVASLAQDRLGSMNGKYYPYGLERPNATANDKEKYTGYFRDSATNLDYADQRYHKPGEGRFMTPDPFAGSVSSKDPGSWNRYAYASGDPINSVDPTGLDDWYLIGQIEIDLWGYGCGYGQWGPAVCGDPGLIVDPVIIIDLTQPSPGTLFSQARSIVTGLEGVTLLWADDVNIGIELSPDVYGRLIQAVPFPRLDPRTIDRAGRVILAVGLSILEALRELLQTPTQRCGDPDFEQGVCKQMYDEALEICNAMSPGPAQDECRKTAYLDFFRCLQGFPPRPRGCSTQREPNVTIPDRGRKKAWEGR